MVTWIQTPNTHILPTPCPLSSPGFGTPQFLCPQPTPTYPVRAGLLSPSGPSALPPRTGQPSSEGAEQVLWPPDSAAADTHVPGVEHFTVLY